jgi:uncharacterized repeat protein (TIGR04138 family)
MAKRTERPVDPKILELVRQDPRFSYEAYDFVCEAVGYTQERLGRAVDDESDANRHVSGAELLRGTCDLAVREFGMMAPIVFKQWGIRTTDDFGEIVFKLIQAERLSKSEDDDLEDFHDLFDLDKTLAEAFELNLGEPERKTSR